jgi:hypothetical protein
VSYFEEVAGTIEKKQKDLTEELSEDLPAIVENNPKVQS